MGFGARFLVDPERFPVAADGRVAEVGSGGWGDRGGEGILLRFAGGPYRVGGLSRAQASLVRERFGALAASAHGVSDDAAEAGGGTENLEPAGELVVRPADAAAFRPPPAERPWEYTFDLDADDAGVRLAGVGFAARLSLASRPRLVLATAAARDDFPGIFENALRVLAAYRLAASGGALLHSAGVESGGGALVAFGPSGAGKSTFAGLALAAGRRVLSDDLNAVVADVERGGAPRVEKVPFAGDLGGGPDPMPPLPLRALCRLRQGSEIAVTRSSPAAALAGLLAAAPFVNVDRFRVPALERSLLALAAAVPVLELTFAWASPFERIEAALAAALAAPVGSVP